ncbi:MAG: hypothetical protein COW01_11025 [Bdellovibrionales bacterium CG12_big_fil_rev_8_21_14_0_65_38_15]|nr:MAG: hypothetical protein COW79_07760 [Bdellovibrionales bacterium CG22_combo_CG10-13_8_21_14_all_38_13]PIQ54337.1 MAG: hypothetical protein COW01_11025 [Bdellovibrionales bacterium CG12_big_fil_rev_8_21_14_0_65_38_15]PIR28292.1 MAG: hypothetical protein COV38_16475 [Bdellovibrionales bacterium CG11_big_fil_rev_8_21_14_0_20_38_13]
MSEQVRVLLDRYSKTTDEQWNEIEKSFRSETIKKGEKFLSVDEVSNRFAVVEEGLFKIFYVDSDGKEAIKTFRAKGGVIGAYAEFLRNIPSRLSVQALRDSKITVIQGSEMVKLFKSSAHWEKIGRRITESLYLEKEEREYQFLCLDAVSRYQSFLKEFKNEVNKIPDYMVASYLGITPVYLSKLKRNS